MNITSSPLLNLPAELRIRIYEYLVTPTYNLDDHKTEVQRYYGLLGACKQLHSEVKTEIPKALGAFLADMEPIITNRMYSTEISQANDISTESVAVRIARPRNLDNLRTITVEIPNAPFQYDWRPRMINRGIWPLLGLQLDTLVIRVYNSITERTMPFDWRLVYSFASFTSQALTKPLPIWNDDLIEYSPEQVRCKKVVIDWTAALEDGDKRQDWEERRTNLFAPLTTSSMEQYDLVQGQTIKKNLEEATGNLFEPAASLWMRDFDTNNGVVTGVTFERKNAGN